MNKNPIKHILNLSATLAALLLACALVLMLLRQKESHEAASRQYGALRTAHATLQAQYENCQAVQAASLQAPACLSPLPPPPPRTSALEDILQPEGAEPGAQARMDAIKKHYEPLFISYFLLHECGMTGTASYHVLVSALSQEIASIDAPGRLQYDIVSSARGSYAELYAAQGCNAATLEPMGAQYEAYVASVAQRFVPR